jgi:hypothetical protein
VDGRADRAAAQWWIAGSRVTGYQKKQPVPARNRAVQRGIDRAPRAVERQAVQIYDSIRLRGTA